MGYVVKTEGAWSKVMKDITDIHCHILPGADDGAADEEESLEMLRQAFRQGIRRLVATPHYPSLNSWTTDRIREVCGRLEVAAREQIDSDMKIYPGQEIYYMDGVLDLLDEGKILTLADSPYTLMEFHPSISYAELYRIVRQIRQRGYLPILAHVERYRCLREKDGRTGELAEAGALLQMNYTAVTGAWHDRVSRWSRRMLLERQIHMLATDMHDRKHRPPEAELAMSWMEKHLDGGYIRELCRDNPGWVLEYENTR